MIDKKKNLESERQQLDNHLHCKEACKDHVEDVHDIAEEFGLLIMLKRHDQTDHFRQNYV